MSNIYVYSANCEDFTNFGLVGALTPISCFFEEEANGMSEITMEHPIDSFGRYTQLVCNNLLMVEVPVRTTPEIDGGTIVTAVEQWTVRTAATITKAQRTLYKKASGSRKIKVVPAGTEVTVVKKSDEGRYKVKCRYGTGWMNPDGLIFSHNQIIADNSQSIESVQPAWTVKPQLFRIYKVEKGILGLTVSARHISYDLLYNLTTFKNTGETTCMDALAEIMDNCVAPHDFEAFTNLENVRTGINWTRTNPIDALLNPETGLTTLYGASLVRDNWELYVLHDPGLNRGVTVEYGKNMTGIKYTESFEDVVTRIIPVGETKDGDDLLLEGDAPYVDSPHINDYPVVYAQELKCEDCKVGTDKVTTAIARARMREQAQAVFDNGGDVPAVEMSVDFISLGDTAEYAQFKNLERLFLWDYVIVRHKLHGIDVTSRIVSIKWNCLLDRMESMDVGSVGKTLANSGITTWQIPTGFSGSKIAGGTVGSGALQSDIIAARHIQSESINTEALQAGSITSEKIAAGAITAEKLEADIIDAVSIEAIVAHIDKIVSENITTDKLYTALAEINSATIKTADIGWAQIKDLVTGQAIIDKGVGEQLMISRLAVTEGNMVSLTVGELVVKGEDGAFYALSVDEDGNIITTQKQVSNDDVKDLSLNAGEKIIEGTVTAACLNATDIFADNALIKDLMAANINVDVLMSREAFIDLLRTSRIVGGKSITMIAEDAEKAAAAARNAAKTFRQETAPGVAEGVKSGDLWVQPSTGAIRQADTIGFVIDENGVMYLEHASGDGYVARFMSDDPYSMEVNFDISVSADGAISGTPVSWNIVQDKSIVALVDNLSDTVDGEMTVHYQPTQPTSAKVNDLWYDTDSGAPAVGISANVYRYNGTAWVDVSDTVLSRALQAAGNAQATADGKITSFAQDDEPTSGMAYGDLWIDTNDQNKLYRYDGSAWVPYRDTAIETVMTEVSNANNTASQAVADIGELKNRVVITGEGLFLRDENEASVLKVNSASVSIGTNVGAAAGYSQFTANYVQFGNYQLRKTTDGGLVFKMGS